MRYTACCNNIFFCCICSSACLYSSDGIFLRKNFFHRGTCLYGDVIFLHAFMQHTDNITRLFCLRKYSIADAWMTSGNPSEVKKVNVSSTAELRKRRKEEIFRASPYRASNAWISYVAFVILQRPPPEIAQLVCPSVVFFSKRSTRLPRDPARPAASHARRPSADRRSHHILEYSYSCIYSSILLHSLHTSILLLSKKVFCPLHEKNIRHEPYRNKPKPHQRNSVEIEQCSQLRNAHSRDKETR
jgi:hypothetical protein